MSAVINAWRAFAAAVDLGPGQPPVFPELADARLRQVSWPVIEAYRDYIAAQLKAGVTAATIHQRLVNEHCLDTSVASLHRWVRANLPEEARRAQVTVLRDTPPAGQEAQIDYGKLGMWLDPRCGWRRTVWAFVMVLACSRHMFVRPTLVMDQAEWTQAHVEAFAFFGGVPARLVPDNLKTGWPGPTCTTRRSIARMRSWPRITGRWWPRWGVQAQGQGAGGAADALCAGLVLAGPGFTSVEDMRADALRWSSDVAGQRACPPLDGATPAGVFAAVEAPALAPLPVAPFVLATWSAAKVSPDIHAKVGGAPRCTRCPGDTSVSGSRAAPPRRWCSSSWVES